MESIKCHLCEKSITNYNPTFHHLLIDEPHGVDICPECVDKFVKWQTKIYATLFPTRALKKRVGDKMRGGKNE
jgi:hypothetical protein